MRKHFLIGAATLMLLSLPPGFGKTTARQNVVKPNEQQASPISQVHFLLQKIESEYGKLKKGCTEKQAEKAMGEIAAKLISQLKSPDQVGLLAVEAINASRAGDIALKDWHFLGNLLYCLSLDFLSDQHTAAAKRAMRRIAENLRGELFYTHTADMWIQAAMRQNGEEPGSKERSGWYINQMLIEKYSGTPAEEVKRLEEQAKLDRQNHVAIPENIAPPERDQ